MEYTENGNGGKNQFITIYIKQSFTKKNQKST